MSDYRLPGLSADDSDYDDRREERRGYIPDTRLRAVIEAEREKWREWDREWKRQHPYADVIRSFERTGRWPR